MANKKIKNAKEFSVLGIKFKSKLECTFYKLLKENFEDVRFEAMTFHLWEGFKPTIPFYTRNKQKEFVLDTKKIIDIKYTPDFIVVTKNIVAFVEAKGIENDVFYLKKKMFRKYLEEHPFKRKSMYFECFTKGELTATIKIIKDYDAILDKGESELPTY